MQGVRKKMKNMLAVIPARGGSKGVPGKNIKPLAGMPLIGYTIKAAVSSGIFSKIIVSTDSREIADIAKAYGAEVPFLRPIELSGDLVSSDDVILHALFYYQSMGIDYDEVCKLQPTSPLRTEKHLKDAYLLFCEKKADFLVSVCACEHSPLWTGVLGEDLRMDNFLSEEAKRACRQELPVYYRLNGAIYMADVCRFYKNKSFFGENSVAYIMGQKESVDIDSPIDFALAEAFMRDALKNIES